jgi:ribosome-binding protein aMBF1 (putative translation factor)
MKEKYNTMIKTKDGMKIIDSIIGDDLELRDMCEQAALNAQVAQLLYEARTLAGLSQAELAKIVGTTQSVISLLESAEYEGHSLSMLQKIAKALNREVRIDLVPQTAHDLSIP